MYQLERGRMTEQHIEGLIRQTIAGDGGAREELAAFIVDFVDALRLPQLGPFSRDPDCRAEVCARVVVRFLVGDHHRLHQFITRESRNFRALLRITTTRVAIDLARSMSRNTSSKRSSAFTWAHELELTDGDATTIGTPAARVDLYAVGEYLDQYSDPIAVELLRLRILRGEPWNSLAERYKLSSDAARQRVRRLREDLRTWYFSSQRSN